MTDLRLERALDAPPEAVFSYLTEHGKLMQWWGPEGMTLPDVALDFSRPGPWFSVMQSAEGQKFKVSGQVTTVRPHERVAFTWAWHDAEDRRGPESQVVIDLEPLPDGRTRLILNHYELGDDESARNHSKGWTSSLNKLERQFR
ncbi:SRPBCC family protein [Frigidibacter sp. ROC022]|uniref:SRPBCC family protein n=1 Tax=Frigidibacter sp. ROC022 TaxID=2971796 RepID=UPI00215A94F6|nr:SRPBCC domain-containing protein [Frigidibacter sp. ROC022]MCR8726764.1 SRPBCC domain-containing protein [Frigidibacter sp. ROC022]